MHFPFELLPQLIQIAHVAAMLGGLFIVSRLKRPRDFERAALISRIVDAAVAEYLAMNPGKSWAEIVQEITRIILANGAGAKSPTGNGAIIKREVIRALESRGIKGS